MAKIFKKGFQLLEEEDPKKAVRDKLIFLKRKVK